ncbi:MAG: hypothetical protein CMH81_06150 [Nitrospiraceae bacterium]|nr:hypothetical protein [Nitrospiraceae bacterium]|tara:strand:- start:2072 stop:3466 length:1395 start_codon:yes stop_codon:yes gene_type:complete
MHKRTVIVFVLFVALLGLVMITVFKPQERNISRLLIPTVLPETVDKIAFDADETFELLKESEQWVLDDGRLADPEMIERALESLGNLASTELVSSNPEKHAIYEVDEEKGHRVTVFVQNQPVVDFVIGKASTFTGMYVRLADTDDVYLAQGSSVKSYFASSKADWQRLQLFDESLADVVSLAMVLQDGTGLDLVQGENKEWALRDMSVLPKGFRFDGSRVRSLVSEFLNLKAKEVLVMSPDPAVSGLGTDGNADTYSLSLRNGVTHTLRVGNLDSIRTSNLDEQNRYAQFDEDRLLLIEVFRADNLRRALNDFHALNLMEFDPNNVTRLSIKSKTERRAFEKKGGQWSVAGDSVQPSPDFVLNGAVVERSIQELSRVVAMSHLESVSPSDKDGLRDLTFEIAVALESDETITLVLGAELKELGAELKASAQTAYYARGNTDDGAYLVTDRAVAQFIVAGFDRWR